MQIEQQMAVHMLNEEHVGVMVVALFLLCNWYFT